MSNSVELILKNIVGPFPANDKCVAVVSGGSKVFGFPITVTDAVLTKQTLQVFDTPYIYSSQILNATGVKVKKSSLFIIGGEFYSSIQLEDKEGKSMKLSFDSPVHSLNTSISNAIPLTISVQDLDKVEDCSESYENIKKICRFPMTKISGTEELQWACEFVDKVFNE